VFHLYAGEYPNNDEGMTIGLVALRRTLLSASASGSVSSGSSQADSLA
jgi:hypothetical protein